MTFPPTSILPATLAGNPLVLVCIGLLFQFHELDLREQFHRSSVLHTVAAANLSIAGCVNRDSLPFSVASSQPSRKFRNHV
jgi:hypothetical protein